MEVIRCPFLSYLSLTVVVTAAHRLHPDGDTGVSPTPVDALQSVLADGSHPRCTVIILMDDNTSTARFFVTNFSSGIALFEVAVDGQNANETQVQLFQVVNEARRLEQVSWCVTVVVVSDDPAFLAAFAELSLKGRLLVWSTRLLVVTRLPLLDLQHLHKLLSMTNSMLLIVDDTMEVVRCRVLIHLPYTPQEAKAMQVASWTPNHDLTLYTQLPLFPDKFTKFLERPTLAVGVDHNHIKQVKNNAGVFKDNILDYIGQGMNFSYKYVFSPDDSYGMKLSDGSWSGMIGLVVRGVSVNLPK
ncbi:uncharacterized protein LOC121874001 [Homarus americanus]|uniref:uncharacterized protein LOC121874001 n=1 Tax=Homarus americanus TaxID=6706 RepID=UPI001C43CCFD|nr:uncharacterized protein LOC121874001 [Homarus americanus]